MPLVCLTLDVFAQRVLDRVVVEREGLVSRRIVGVDGGLPVRMVLDESLQRLRVGRLDDCRCDLIRLAVLRAHDRRLADRPAARVRQFLALRVAHVLPLAAHVGFVHLDRPREQLAVLGQCGTQSLSQKPGGLLGDSQVAVELHARHALEAGHDQERGDNPVLIADLGAFHDRARLGAESLRADPFPASERALSD